MAQRKPDMKRTRELSRMAAHLEGLGWLHKDIGKRLGVGPTQVYQLLVMHLSDERDRGKRTHQRLVIAHAVKFLSQNRDALERMEANIAAGYEART